MPHISHVVSAPYRPSYRTKRVEGSYDLQVSDNLQHSWSFDFPYDDEPWQVGLICGPSGTGKTQLASHIFGADCFYDGRDWPKGKSFLDGFSEDVECKRIFEVLTSVGFSSPPKWLLPYGCLSNGQQFRVQLADVILNDSDFLVFDEFTSVVDRTVACIGANAFQKSLRKNEKKVVLLSCHYDVAEWLEPDWVLDTKDFSFSRGCLRRPEIYVDFYRCTREVWPMFREHHYLSHTLHKGAYCYVGVVNGIVAAFSSVLKFPHRRYKVVAREHRTVVLPDFQGVGIGNRMSEWVASLWAEKGYQFYSITSHPAMIQHRMRSPKWQCVRRPSHAKRGANAKKSSSTSGKRLTASFLWIG